MKNRFKSDPEGQLEILEMRINDLEKFVREKSISKKYCDKILKTIMRDLQALNQEMDNYETDSI